MTDEHVFTVAEFNRNVRMILENAFDKVWIEGEISNFVTPASGHCYFNLKDQSGSLKCVMFKSSAVRLKFDVEDGMSVVCSGRISVYEKQGQYQLYVDKIEPRGRGALHLAFEKLKEKLNNEGLFSEGAKKQVPSFPVRIGVVTSSTGAAIRDILKVTRRRFSNMEITICPVKVQGDAAKDEIASAIFLMNEYNRHLLDEVSGEHLIEAVIVGRGGGSIEDLWAFNEEKVARAIFSSAIPIISAVGHEIDWTISDFVADKRAATPSAAAEMLIPEKEGISMGIEALTDRLSLALGNSISSKEARLKALRESYVLREPVNAILQLDQEVDEFTRRINAGMLHYLGSKENDLRVLRSKIEILDPLSILDRGYSITYKDGKPLKDATELSEGDKLVSRLARGEVASKVE